MYFLLIAFFGISLNDKKHLNLCFTWLQCKWCFYMSAFLSLTETLQQRLRILWHVKNIKPPQVQVLVGDASLKAQTFTKRTGRVSPLVSHLSFVDRRPHSQRRTHPNGLPQKCVWNIFPCVPSKLQVGMWIINVMCHALI